MQTFKLSQIEAEATLAMCEFYKAQTKPKIKVQSKPHKGIFALEKHAKSQLVIPVFGKIVVVAKDEEIADRCFEVKGHGLSDYRVYVKSIFDEEYVTPSNYIQFTKDESEATAKIVWKPAKSVAALKGTKLQLPVIQNCGAIESGEELKLHSMEKKARKTKGLSLDTSIKKACRD